MYKFIGRPSWRDQIPTDFRLPVIPYDPDVNILRGCMFFYAGEKTKLSRVRANFTELAVEKLLHDGFIEIVKNDDKKDNTHS